MRVLLIGYPHSKIKNFLSENTTFFWIDGSKNISLELVNSYSPDYIVLHGCHKILSKDIVSQYNKRIINCHGSYLPYNRGAHPNVWSFIDDTPKGGTIQYITENIDEGDILCQQQVTLDKDDTLASVYWKIRDLLEDMFVDNWDKIINNKISPSKQDLTLGKLHYRKDLETVKHLLPDGWDTPIKNFSNKNNE